jgi:hypothetical protein
MMDGKSFRQKVVDEYLNGTGRNMFVPAEFLAWLEGKPDHRVYPVFFGKDDKEAALEYRLGLVRQFVSGIRIKVMANSADGEASKIYRMPAFVSSVEDRRLGGGYVPFDPSDDAIRKELARQASTALQSWLKRYGDLATTLAVDVSGLPRIIEQLDLVTSQKVAA